MKNNVMYIDLIKKNFLSNPTHIAMVWNDCEISNSLISSLLIKWSAELYRFDIPSGAVVSIEGDFSPNTIALLLALINHNCIIVPLNNSIDSIVELRNSIAMTEYRFCVDRNDNVTFLSTKVYSNHPLYEIIREKKDPGLVLFSSGTTGIPKAAVHNFAPLLKKFLIRKKSYITINFLLFDHWGGLNTLLNTLSSCGTTVIVMTRTSEYICQLIEKYKVSLLPATPSFLNILLLSQAYLNYDLSSLKLITYGAEPMPESTLARLCRIFPNVKFQQTYGLIEVGVLSTKSLENNSLWVKVGGGDYETRIVDGLLQIKTQSMILGYLNADSPITSDGWFMTGDSVEINGEYIRILGRYSELINVGGEKVYPNEIEDVILGCDNISEVRVFGEKNALMGNIICAEITTLRHEDLKSLENRIKNHCLSKLERFKVPVKIFVTNSILHNDRFKKIRSTNSNE